MTRAVLFDLDDTLYPERRFVLSGFAEVASHVSRRFGVPCRQAFATMTLALRRGGRARAFQSLCARFDLPDGIIPELLDVVRSHTPRLRLPGQSIAVLARLRETCRIGILTNGLPATQARKVAALDVAPLVDVVVYACEHGTGIGKPDPLAFHAALIAVGASSGHAIFVGDDPASDIAGARAVGLRSILVGRQRTPHAQCAADRVVRSLSAVPEAVEALFQDVSRCDD